MFDYDTPNKCAFGILSDHNNYSWCGEPATHFVWWEDRKDGMWVCTEHFNYMKQKEEEATEGYQID